SLSMSDQRTDLVGGRRAACRHRFDDRGQTILFLSPGVLPLDVAPAALAQALAQRPVVYDAENCSSERIGRVTNQHLVSVDGVQAGDRLGRRDNGPATG